MFNNPFDSFHNTVAKAKEEREQLDRLLTISTPRERLLVAVIALLILLLVAWLFLGNVARTVAVGGVVVQPRESLPQGNRHVQALVWVEKDVASKIKAGMPAAITPIVTDGKAATLDGKVANIAILPLSEELVPHGILAPVSVYRVTIALEKSLDIGAYSGSKCLIIVELGKQSPVTLLKFRQS